MVDEQEELVRDWFKENYDESMEGIEGVNVDSSILDVIFPPDGGNVVYLVLSDPIDMHEFASIIEGSTVSSNRHDDVRLKVDVKKNGSEGEVRKIVEDDGKVSSIKVYGSKFKEGKEVALSRGKVILPSDGEPVDSSAKENLDVLVKYLEGKYKD